MIMYVMGFLTQIQIQPAVMYIVAALEISYVLIRFLLIVIPKDKAFHKFLLRLFQGLKQVEDDIKDRFPTDEDNES